MAAHTPAYRLLPVRLSAAQTSMDGLVSALWRSICPTRRCGPNCRLDQIFARMHRRPELAALQLCPYYFDQVASSVPARASSNAALQLFASPTETQRRHAGTSQDARPDAGVHLSRLRQLQDVHTGGSITTRVFLQLMYGHGDLVA